MKRHILAILVSISSLTAAANDMVIMPGPAIYSCTQWSDSAGNSLRTPLAMWLLGSASGSNIRTAPITFRQRFLTTIRHLHLPIATAKATLITT